MIGGGLESKKEYLANSADYMEILSQKPKTQKEKVDDDANDDDGKLAFA